MSSIPQPATRLRFNELSPASFFYTVHESSVPGRRELARTLPAVIANTQLLPGEVAVAVVGAAAVVPAVGNVAGLPLPVLVTFTVHSAGGRVPRGALPVAGAVIGTRVDPRQEYLHLTDDLRAYHRSLTAAGGFICTDCTVAEV